jgi:hypothetical protein
MSKSADITPPEVPECEKLAKIHEIGHNKQISDFLEWVQGLSAVFTFHDRAAHDVDIHELITLLESIADLPWEQGVIVDFWEWLSEKSEHKELVRVFDIRIEDTLYEYFGIDRDKLESERREILAGCRAGNALHDARKDLGLDKS